jgi:cell division protein FtsZ
VTKPFGFEGARRRLNAEKATEALRDKVDTLITIPNDRLKDVAQQDTSIVDAFRIVDDVLRHGVQGISDLITVPGLINLDFADVRAVMKEAGSALMGIGRASGEGRAANAAREAIASPLLEVNIAGAQGVLFNVTGGPSLGLFEVDEAAEIIRSTADPEANIIFGTVIDERMGDDISITVIATGFDASRKRERTHMPSAAEVLATLAAPLHGASEPRPTAIPVSANNERSLAGARVPVDRLDGGRRAAAAEVEDLDIPAFLRRNR